MSSHATQSLSRNLHDYSGIISRAVLTSSDVFQLCFKVSTFELHWGKHIHCLKFCSFSMLKACKICSLMSLIKFLSSSLFMQLLQLFCRNLNLSHSKIAVSTCAFFIFSFLWFLSDFSIHSLSPLKSSPTFLICFLRLSFSIGTIFPILCTTICEVCSFLLFCWKLS